MVLAFGDGPAPDQESCRAASSAAPPHVPGRPGVPVPRNARGPAGGALHQHYLGQLAKENAAETLVVALLSQISDLDEERVMTIDRRLSQVSLFYEVIHEQVQHGYRCPSRIQCRR